MSDTVFLEAPFAVIATAREITMSSSDAADYYKAYEHYSGLLRTWLVAYGIGAPVIVLTNETVWYLLRASGESKLIAAFFLGGVAIQVLLATLNKVLMWSSCYAEDHEKFQSTRRFAIVKHLRGMFWIDTLADLGAIALFGLATYKIFVVVTA